MEFFDSLFSGKRARRELHSFSERLKKLQDALGELNDLVVHRKMTAESALNAPPQNRRAHAFAAGVILEHEDQAAKPLLAVAKKEIRWLEAADAI
jgi:CHAD domain-containing protein